MHQNINEDKAHEANEKYDKNVSNMYELNSDSIKEMFHIHYIHIQCLIFMSRP